MDGKEKINKHLKKIRKTEFYSRLVKIVFLSSFIILIPLIIYDNLKEGDIITIVVLITAEIVFIGLTIFLLKSAIELNNIKNSRIYMSIENPSSVTEIVITPNKIIFEIKGMEDETLFIKESEYRSLLISNISEVFGEDKIVSNN